jgi:membrane fusion protein, macrolide-specific efflux system
MKKSLLIAVVIALGFGLIAYRRLRNGDSTEPHYTQASLTRQRMVVTIESTGIVEPRNRLEIRPPIGGRIDQVLIEEGAQVAEGDIIAWMSSTERAALLDAARPEGEDVLRKWSEVYKPTPIIAPLSGRIIARNVEPGQTVTAQDTTFVLSDTLIIMAQVDETDVGTVSLQQQATVTLDAYQDIVVSGGVRQIAFEATIINNVTIYEVEVAPDRTPECMKSGMTATVQFLVAEANDVLTLPADAIQTEGGKSIVLVDDGDPETTPERYRVLTGLTCNGRVEILAGLQGDEQVVREAFVLPQKTASGSSPFMAGRR